jgi:ribosomal protein L16 Arg81 hydroxylase
MNLQALFGDIPVPTFAAEYWHRLPFARSGSAAGVFHHLGGWDVLGVVLGDAAADVMVVRGGEQQASVRTSSKEKAHALSHERQTIFVRHAERQHAELAELAAAFETTFCGPVDVQFFATPPGQAGFSWHYDAEDVFILQTTGEKEYSLRKNTVNPWPLQETLPTDMRYEREIMPLMRVRLKAGDLLYIPCGYWHKADASASTEIALSLAVGVMSRAAIDVLDGLRPRLMESLLWRQRLPLVGASSPLSDEQLRAAYADLLKELCADLERRFSDPRLANELLAGGRQCCGERRFVPPSTG